jgi:hypothetical protein
MIGAGNEAIDDLPDREAGRTVAAAILQRSRRAPRIKEKRQRLTKKLEALRTVLEMLPGMTGYQNRRNTG